MTATPEWLAAALLGLLGGVHCVGMCGGVVGALGVAIPAHLPPARRLWLMLGYNLGRIASYTLAGVLVGAFGYLFSRHPELSRGLRTFAGLLMVAMGLYLAGWWQGLAQLEKAGGWFWRRLQPAAGRLLPVTHQGKALLIGAAWGWLPCGLVYSALALAATQQSALGGAGVMAAFGLATLPTLMATGVAAQQLRHWLQHGGVRAGAGLLVILFGLWTLFHALFPQHGGHGAQADGQHEPPAMHQHSH